MNRPFPDPWTGAIDAPAKVNLSLHVVGRRADGYHLIEGLVAFAACADRLAMEPAALDGLSVTGPFAACVPAGPDNLVVRALHLARRVAAGHGVTIGPKHIHIDKRLPVAAGLGGGSADAAALLRMVAHAEPVLAEPLRREAVRLGADVPMCLQGTGVCVSGIGEETRAVALPALAMVLVNPGIPVSTPAVFAALKQRENAPPPPMPPDATGTPKRLIRYLHQCRNDLEKPALLVAPIIGQALAALRGEGAELARMSGSGASVFALFETGERAERAAASIAQRHPNWWVVATKAGDGEP